MSKNKENMVNRLMNYFMSKNKENMVNRLINYFMEETEKVEEIEKERIENMAKYINRLTNIAENIIIKNLDKTDAEKRSYSQSGEIDPDLEAVVFARNVLKSILAKW